MVVVIPGVAAAPGVLLAAAGVFALLLLAVAAGFAGPFALDTVVGAPVIAPLPAAAPGVVPSGAVAPLGTAGTAPLASLVVSPPALPHATARGTAIPYTTLFQFTSASSLSARHRERSSGDMSGEAVPPLRAAETLRFVLALSSAHSTSQLHSQPRQGRSLGRIRVTWRAEVASIMGN